MKLRVDRFGRAALEAYPISPDTALRYYLGDSASGRAGWALPPFLRDGETGAEEVEVEVGADVRRELELEAGRQGTPPGVLAAHALMYFLADWDSGRAAARLGVALKKDDAEAD